MFVFLLTSHLPWLVVHCCLESCLMCVFSGVSVSLSPCRLPPVRGIFQARALEGAAISSSRGSSGPRDQIPVSCISGIGRWALDHRAWEVFKELYWKPKLRVTGNPGQTAPALRCLTPVSAPPCLWVCTFPTWEGKGRPFFLHFF